MKKHLCKPAFGWDKPLTPGNIAECDPTLKVYYHKDQKKNRRLSAKEIVKQMDKGNVCKACIRIVMVERLNGTRPGTVIGPLNQTFLKDAITKLASAGVSTKQASKNISTFMKAMEPVTEKLMKQQPIIEISKNYAWKSHRPIGEVST